MTTMYTVICAVLLGVVVCCLFLKKPVKIQLTLHRHTDDSFELSDTEVDMSPIPFAVLKDEDYQTLGLSKPADKAPLIGVLLGRGDGKKYEINVDYITSLGKHGARLRFLTYDRIPVQLTGLDAIFLIGGAFNHPPKWNVPPTQEPVEDLRSKAYRYLISYADKMNIPLLGICAGFQMMTGVMLPQETEKLIPVNDLALHKEIEKTKEAHTVLLKKKSLIKRIFNTEKIAVNSRHGWQIYLPALENQDKVIVTGLSEDNVPEVIEFKDHENWLGVQFHPEVFAALGKEKFNHLFKIFVEFAEEYKKTKK